MADQDVLEGVQASLDRLGYAILPLLTTDEVARLRAQFDELHPTPGAGFETDFERSDAGFKAGVTETTRWVWDRVAPHLPGYEPFMASYLVKWPTPDSHLDLHADWTYTDERVQPSFAAWIPLVDTGPDLPNGPLLVVPGSHRLVQSWRGTATPAWYEAGREGFLAAAVPVTAPAGCVVLFDNRILHHSPPNLGSEPRPVLAGAFVPIGATLLHVVGDGGPMARVIEVEPSFFAAHNPSGLRLERPDVPDDALEVPLVDGTVDPIGLAADHGIDDAGCFHDGEPRPGDRRWEQPTGPLDLDRHRARLGTALDLSTVPWAPTTVDADPDARTQLVLLAGARPTPSGSELLGSSAASGAWWSLRLVRVPPGATVDLPPTGTGRAGQVAVLGLGPDDPALLVEGASGWASVAGASAVLVPDEAIRVRNRSSHEVAALVGEPLPPAGRLPEGLHARLLWRRAGRDRWQQAVELAEAVS